MKKLNDLWIGIKRFLRQVIMILMSLVFIIGLIFFFRWTGYKGLIAFFIGMVLMAYLLLSKNMALKVVVDTFGSDDYITSLTEKDKETIRKKGISEA